MAWLGEFLGTLLASGIVSAGALFALFKIFGEKWLDAKLEQRLAKYKHEHDQEIERLRGRINALMDRTIKLHQHEFETLPQVWSRLNDAFGLTQSLVASFQSYPDLSGISADHLDEFLNTTPLHNWEKVTRLADGDLSRLPALAENLVNTRVDAILAAAPPAVQAASGATKSIPVIALDLESDPVASGFIASLARPGGNVTGVFLDFPEFSAKCLQMLIETLPTLASLAVLWDPTTGSLQLKSVEAAAQGFGVSVKVFEARRVADIAEAFYALERSHVQGVLILSSPLFGGNPQMIADLAVRRTVPTISLFPDIAREGGLLAYGPEIEALYRQAAGMARKVLGGAMVAELPAERPTRFQLVANLRTAKLFGITLPPSILLRADEVIE